MDADLPEGAGPWRRLRSMGGASGWIHDSFRRRLAPAGWRVAALWFGALVVSRMPGRDVGDLILLLLSAALVVSWILSWRPIPLQGSWHLDGNAREGDQVAVVVDITNPTGRVFRNVGASLFRFGDGLDATTEGRFLPRVGPGETVTVQLPLATRHRGSSGLEAPCLLMLEPMGLMRSVKRLRGRERVAVSPRPLALKSLSFLLQGVDGPRFGSALGWNRAHHGDPVGVRPYRPGDALRDLHHRSWARRGVPVSRERSVERGEGVHLSVWTGGGGFFGRPLIDGLLELASTVATWLEDQGGLAECRIDGVRVAHAPRESIAQAFSAAVANLPRAGWRPWVAPFPAMSEGEEVAPELILAIGGSGQIPSGGSGRKLILLDWSTRTVEVDPEAKELRVSPLVLVSPEVRL